MKLEIESQSLLLSNSKVNKNLFGKESAEQLFSPSPSNLLFDEESEMIEDGMSVETEHHGKYDICSPLKENQNYTNKLQYHLQKFKESNEELNKRKEKIQVGFQEAKKLVEEFLAKPLLSKQAIRNISY